jgi:hypothetical protein
MIAHPRTIQDVVLRTMSLLCKRSLYLHRCKELSSLRAVCSSAWVYLVRYIFVTRAWGGNADAVELGQSQWRVSPSRFTRCETLVWNRCLPQCIVSLYNFIGSRVPQSLIVWFNCIVALWNSICVSMGVSHSFQRMWNCAQRFHHGETLSFYLLSVSCKKWNFADVALYLMCMKHSWNPHWDRPWTGCRSQVFTKQQNCSLNGECDPMGGNTPPPHG